MTILAIDVEYVELEEIRSDDMGVMSGVSLVMSAGQQSISG